MIRVTVDIDEEGCVRAFAATGHSGGGTAGNDTVCAAASILLRTACRTIAAEAGIDARAEANVAGEMTLIVDGYAKEKGEWLRGASDSLVNGLTDLARDFPAGVVVAVSRIDAMSRESAMSRVNAGRIKGE